MRSAMSGFPEEALRTTSIVSAVNKIRGANIVTVTNVRKTAVTVTVRRSRGVSNSNLMQQYFEAGAVGRLNYTRAGAGRLPK